MDPCLLTVQYYPLEVSYFKSSLDAHLLGLLWNSYWMKTLCAAPLLQNHALTTSHISDLGARRASSAGERTGGRACSSMLAVCP